MDQTQQYIDFLEDTMPLLAPIQSAPDHRMAVRALLQLAHDEGQLDLDGPWHMDSKYAAQLTRDTGFTPDGGWHGLAGLLVGCHIFRADNKRGFVPTMTMDELLDLPAFEIQQRLVEAFSRYLIPPATAAGLFMLLGIHPGWGLRLVFETQRKTPMATPRPIYEDPVLFPSEIVHTLQETLFSVVGTIFDILLVLDQDKRYRTEKLALLIVQTCTIAREHIHTMFPHCNDLLTPIFIFQLQEARALQRAMDFVKSDLFGHYLIPAGVVQCFADQSFCVNHNALEPDYKMHAFNAVNQSHGLAKLLTQNSNAMVA